MLEKTDVKVLEASLRCPRETAADQLHRMIEEHRKSPTLDLARQIASLVTILEGP